MAAVAIIFYNDEEDFYGAPLSVGAQGGVLPNTTRTQKHIHSHGKSDEGIETIVERTFIV